MREKSIFQNKTVVVDEEVVQYNYVEINELHLMINKLNINTNDFIMLCYLVGNDFIPGLLTTDIKRRGLDKLMTSYEEARKIVKKDIIEKSDKNIKINYEVIIEIFKNLEYTERGIWKNINRDKFEKTELEKQENLNKFLLGKNMNTDCLEKIKFSSETLFSDNSILKFSNLYFTITSTKFK